MGKIPVEELPVEELPAEELPADEPLEEGTIYASDVFYDDEVGDYTNTQSMIDYLAYALSDCEESIADVNEILSSI